MTGSGGWLLLALVVLTACAGSGKAVVDDGGDEATPGPSKPGLWLDFDEVTAEFGSLLPGVANRGGTAVRTDVSTRHGGRVRLAAAAESAAGSTADGAAARFPSYAVGAEAPAAALLVWEVDEGALSPGDQDFAFGASFQLDRESEGEGDNGDNLMQRGLFADAVQYKLQIDHGVPSCRIAGSGGEVVVKLDMAVQRGHWFAVRCERRADRVVLELKDLTGERAVSQASGTGPTGELTFAYTVPMSVGAKTLANGVVPTSASDQFNGVVDDVFFRILGDPNEGVN